jgi:glycosyltransferase involved in cell wall biosynthesis
VALVSIITIVKDHVTGLRETFSSLNEQVHKDWEMIIVAGISRDSTMELAKEISNRDARVRVIEESGQGIYAAMNEGIQNANGDYSWFMNAGDRFANAQVIQRALLEASNTKVGLVIGGHRIDGDNERHVYSYPKKLLSTFDFAFNRRGGCHQSMIFRTRVLREIGGFNADFSLASDFDLILRVIDIAGAIRVPEIYASIEPGGTADQSILSVHRQKHQIRRIFFENNLITLLSSLWTFAAHSKVVSRRLLRSPKYFYR